jgi:hypothetical protein
MSIKKKYKVSDCQFTTFTTTESSTDFIITLGGQPVGMGWFDDHFIYIDLCGKEDEDDNWLMLSQDIEDDFYDGKLTQL